MIITLYSDFAKRKNSTKIPEIGTGSDFDGEIKKDFALTGFTVKFAFDEPSEIPLYSYAYISVFSRYYFVTDWYFDAGLWHAVLAEDVLASYRDAIGNSSQFINRSAAKRTLAGNTLIDPNAKTCGPVMRDSATLSPESFWGAGITSNDGLVVMGVIGNAAGSIGAVTYYALSMSNFSAFMGQMLSSPSWLNISTTEISAELQKALINPTQYIVYCRWLPLNAQQFLSGLIPQAYSPGTLTNVLSLGWWTFTLSEYAMRLDTVGSGWVYRNALMRVPKHPYSGNGHDFYSMSPYTTYMLQMPPFGVFEIDSTELYGYSYIGIEVNLSVLTGDATLKVAGSNGGTVDFTKSFLVYEGQVGVQLPIAQVSGNISNYKNALSVGAVAGIDAILSGGG